MTVAVRSPGAKFKYAEFVHFFVRLSQTYEYEMVMMKSQ